MIKGIMKLYELMLVVRPGHDADEVKTYEQLLKKILPPDGVTIRDVNILGKKPLAYPIKKVTEAVYVVCTLEAETLHVAALEKLTRVYDEILRYIVIKKDGGDSNTKPKSKAS